MRELLAWLVYVAIAVLMVRYAAWAIARKPYWWITSKSPKDPSV